jgi:hypothetical protein
MKKGRRLYACGPCYGCGYLSQLSAHPKTAGASKKAKAKKEKEAEAVLVHVHGQSIIENRP